MIVFHVVAAITRMARRRGDRKNVFDKTIVYAPCVYRRVPLGINSGKPHAAAYVRSTRIYNVFVHEKHGTAAFYIVRIIVVLSADAHK